VKIKSLSFSRGVRFIGPVDVRFGRGKMSKTEFRIQKTEVRISEPRMPNSNPELQTPNPELQTPNHL